jgi:hypothetical protein
MATKKSSMAFVTNKTQTNANQTTPTETPLRDRVVVTDADRMKAAKDMYASSLFGERTPEIYAMGLKPTSVNGQIVFSSPGLSSATMTQGRTGNVGFVKNPNSNTFSMVVLGKGGTGMQFTDDRNLTGAQVLDKMSEFAGGFAKATGKAVEKGGTVETSTGTVNISKGGEKATTEEMKKKGPVRGKIVRNK